MDPEGEGPPAESSLEARLQQVRRDGGVKRSFYGDARYSSSIRGCTPVPKDDFFKRTKLAFPNTELVDEFMTTQCCWKCGARSQPVASVVDGRRRRVRGLVYCDSSTCGYLTNRDFQGALNIMACGKGPRPKQLGRTPVVGHKRTDVHIVTTAARECVPRRPPRATPCRHRH